jgi:hypothetical protein
VVVSCLPLVLPHQEEKVKEDPSHPNLPLVGRNGNSRLSRGLRLILALMG